ncbi:hypothetical protein Tco_0489834 [Tanacetum coccineum]
MEVRMNNNGIYHKATEDVKRLRQNLGHSQSSYEICTFLANQRTDKMERLTQIYLNEVVSRHGVPISIILDRALRLHRLRHFMDESVNHPSAGRRLEIANSLAARDRQKSYAVARREPLEFQVGDKVMLNVSPWKGVIRFGKREKLNPRYIGPLNILARIGPVAYRLELLQELNKVHNTFTS